MSVHLAEDKSGGIVVSLCGVVAELHVNFIDETDCPDCLSRWYQVTGSWPVSWQAPRRRS